MNEKPADFKEKESAGMATAMQRVENAMEALLKSAGADAVFGEPIRQNGTLIIPAAEVMGGMGLGGGFGKGMHKEKKEPREPEEGGGGGGGGRVRSRPVAVVVASGGDIEVKPVIDRTRIALTAIVANGLAALMFLRLFRRR